MEMGVIARVLRAVTESRGTAELVQLRVSSLRVYAKNTGWLRRF
jgi:hypothetical protein